MATEVESPPLAPAPPRRRRPRRPGRPSPASVDVLLALLLGVSAVLLRRPGLGGSGLHGDDAWVLLGAREPWPDRVALGSSAPGFAIAVGLWSHLRPHPLPWTQIPPLILGGAAVAGVVLAGRRLGLSRPACAVAAVLLLVGVNPTAYSIRIKQYSFDAAAGALLVYGAVAVGRRPDRRRCLAFAVGGAAAVAVSASVLPVLLPAAGYAVLVSAARAGRRIRPPPPLLAVTIGLLGFLALWWAAVLRSLPSALRDAWTGRYLPLDRGLPALCDTVVYDLRGLLGGFSRAPFLPQVVLLCLALAVVGVRTRRRPELSLVVAPLVVTLGLSAARMAPFGGGRTDAYLYPSLALLAAVPADLVVRAARRLPPPARLLPAAGTVGLLVVGSLYAADHPPRYTVNDFPAVLGAVRARARPGDLLVVGPQERYVYAYQSGDPYRLVRGDAYTAGFTVRALRSDVRVVASDRPEPGYDPRAAARLADGADRVWYVGAGGPGSAGRDSQQEALLSTVGLRRRQVVQRAGCFGALWIR